MNLERFALNSLQNLHYKFTKFSSNFSKFNRVFLDNVQLVKALLGLNPHKVYA